MKRLPILCLILLAFTAVTFAQTGPQEIDLKGATAVHIYAAFSSVEVTTGADGVVGVEHNLSVAGEERTDLRRLSVQREGTVLSIRELKPRIDLLRQTAIPKSSTEMPKGVLTTFTAAPAVQEVMVDATLKVVVPEGIPVTVETEYGGIVADNVPGLLGAKAKYGSVKVVYRAGPAISGLELSSQYGIVDVTIPAGENLNMDILTEYGALHSELDIVADESASEQAEFYQRLIGKLGTGGKTVICAAPYGDVYLREGE
ncbi:MAG: hypothetical protein AAF597_00730 [Bacteroidota bacterium]